MVAYCICVFVSPNARLVHFCVFLTSLQTSQISRARRYFTIFRLCFDVQISRIVSHRDPLKSHLFKILDSFELHDNIITYKQSRMYNRYAFYCQLLFLFTFIFSNFIFIEMFSPSLIPHSFDITRQEHQFTRQWLHDMKQVGSEAMYRHYDGDITTATHFSKLFSLDELDAYIDQGYLLNVEELNKDQRSRLHYGKDIKLVKRTLGPNDGTHIN